MLVLLCAPMVHGFAMRPMHGARSAPKPLLARRALMASGPAALLGELQVPPPPEAVVAAVEKIGSNQRVIAADVAAKGGMDLNTAARGLNELASALAGADGLSVAASSSGDLVYSFPENVRGELSSRSASAKARETWDAAKPALITAGRVSFGLALIASIVVVYAAIVAIQTSSDEDDRRDDRRGGGMMGGFGGGGWGYNPFWSPLDLFWPRPYYYGWYAPPPQMSLPEAFFSFVFGDGDPNAALRAARVQALAGAIRQNGGAVVAEQIAPYLDPPGAPPKGDEILVDESWVLPACLELGGRPEVQEDGTIVYVFDDLKVSALQADAAVLLADQGLASLDETDGEDLRDLARQRGVPEAGDVRSALRRWAAAQLASQPLFPEGCLVEKEVPFSNAEPGQLFAAAALGVANFVGVGYLGSLLAQLPAGAVLPGVIGLAASLYPALSLYAVAYVAVPAVRYALLSKRNAQIAQRNEARRVWRDALRSGGAALRKKLGSARSRSGKVRVVGEADLAFDSAKDLAEQPTDAEADDWERRLNARG